MLYRGLKPEFSKQRKELVSLKIGQLKLSSEEQKGKIDEK